MSTNVPVTKVDRDGGTAQPAPTAADDVNGNNFVNNSRMFLEVANTDTADHTVTVALPTKVDGQEVADPQYTVTAGSTLLIGPWPVQHYTSVLEVTVDSNLLDFRAYAV